MGWGRGRDAHCNGVLFSVTDSGLGELVEPMVWHYLTNFQLPAGQFLCMPECVSDSASIPVWGSCVFVCVCVFLYVHLCINVCGGACVLRVVGGCVCVWVW